VSGSPFAADFGPFDGRVWLNSAHQGPLPRPAVEALEAAVAAKRAPHAIDDGDFLTAPRELREVLGRLIGAPASEVILGNSASYGVQVLAQSTRWRSGDEVLFVQGDFLANIFPWLPFEEDGVAVRALQPAGAVVEPDELEAALSPRTRVFCTSWVSTFTGHLADLAGLGAVCRRHGVTFVVNATQGLGRRPLDVTALPLDALTCAGYKWLCGPYATGFAWFHPRLVESLRPRQAYWLAMPDDVELDLNDEGDYELRNDLGARAFDVFGTANFFDFVPWRASVAHLLGCGIERTAEHTDGLVHRLAAGLLDAGYRILGPTHDPRLSIVVASHRDPDLNPRLHAALADAGVDVALRAGNLRIAPHLYNGEEDVDRALEVLVAARRPLATASPRRT
jgi:cysteine desulfurase / selenocysteine lyase